MDSIPNIQYPGGVPSPTTPTNHVMTPTQLPVLENFTPDAPKSYANQLWEVKILQLVYFPLTNDGLSIDQAITGDVGETLAIMRAHVDTQTALTIAAMEEGCHETIAYRIMGRVEIHEGYPLTYGREFRPSGYSPALVDYKAILNRFNINSWLSQGINQVWIWGYHGDMVTLWESNLASSYGNASNSDRNKNELPIVPGKSYTVFNFNYGRGAAEAVESQTHQIEALLNFIDGRDTLPKEIWNTLLFWGYFVGSDATHRMVPRYGVYRCGWTHYCPNSLKDYEWESTRTVTSDLFDWRPEGGGATQQVNANDWSATDDGGLAWKIKWMQAIPRANNGLTFKGKDVGNWWEFVGDFDGAMKAGRKLAN
jgi:hypothetical protein